MQRSFEPDCNEHIGQKKPKFCMNLDCWKKICSKCATERHKGHNVIEYANLPREAKSVKEILIQSKKGDLMSIRRIIESINSFKIYLHEVKTKRKEEARLAVMNITERINKVSEETNQRFEELHNSILYFEETLKESYETQAQEVSKIPELADAVISMGTVDDLKTFFEMCQEGSETNAEVMKYKKTADYIRQNIEEFAMTDPLSFVFGFDKSIYERPKTSEGANILTNKAQSKGETKGVRKHARVNSTLIESSTANTSRNSHAKLSTDKSYTKSITGQTRNSKTNLSNAKTPRELSKIITTKLPNRKPIIASKVGLSPKCTLREPRTSKPNHEPHTAKTSSGAKGNLKSKEVAIFEIGSSLIDYSVANISIPSREIHKELLKKFRKMKISVNEVKNQLKDTSMIFDKNFEAITHIPYTINRVLKFINNSKTKFASIETNKSICKDYIKDFAKRVLNSINENKNNEEQALSEIFNKINEFSITIKGYKNKVIKHKNVISNLKTKDNIGQNTVQWLSVESISEIKRIMEGLKRDMGNVKNLCKFGKLSLTWTEVCNKIIEQHHALMQKLRGGVLKNINLYNEELQKLEVTSEELKQVMDNKISRENEEGTIIKQVLSEAQELEQETAERINKDEPMKVTNKELSLNDSHSSQIK